VAIRPRLEGGRWGGGAGRVAAQLDVRLRGLDVVNHGAELVDEAYQGHVHPLADGLAGGGEVAVEGVVVAAVEVVERERRGGSGALGGTGRLLHHHSVQAEGLNQQRRLKLQRGEVHPALSGRRRQEESVAGRGDENENSWCQCICNSVIIFHRLDLLFLRSLEVSESTMSARRHSRVPEKDRCSPKYIL